MAWERWWAIESEGAGGGVAYCKEGGRLAVCEDSLFLGLYQQVCRLHGNGMGLLEAGVQASFL